MGKFGDDRKRKGLLRALVYGPPKSRKTWWVTKLAEAGFNVLLCDIEDGAAVAGNLSEAAQNRIYRLDLRPNSESLSTSGGAAISYAMSGEVVNFDEETRAYAAVQKVDPDTLYTQIDFRQLGPHDVLVFDTWTAFVQQMIGLTVVISNPTVVPKLEWDDFAKVRLILDNFLTNVLKLNCHVVIIAHSETYAKRKPTADPKDKPKDAIGSVRLQPCSVTRAHAETMAGKFNEVFYMEIPNPTMGTMISTKGSEDFDAGCRTVAPGIYKFDSFNLASLMPSEILEAVKDSGEFSSPAITTRTGAEISALRAGNSATPIKVGAGPIIKKVN